MRESKFIKQNQEKWKEYERLLQSNTKDPEKLNDLFINVTDDLSFARTFYKNRSVRVYLNRLAQRIFSLVYKKNSFKWEKFAEFWTDEVPQIMWVHRREMLVSFLLFVLCFTIGWVSSAHDPSFSRLILGDQYVDMTIENIESGDPMAVYKKMNQMDMTFGIALNNLRVSFMTFVLGVFFGIGTIGIMIQNGVMLGTFQQFFHERDLFWDSFLTIWIHGTVEISCIIIAGGAGLVIGRGLVFPGTYNRMQSFLAAAQHGVKIMFAISPLIVFAAILEGFLTRYTDVPDMVRAAVIMGSLFMILGYFFYYPRLKAADGFKKPLKKAKLNPDRSLIFDYPVLRSAGEIFMHAFLAFKKYLKPVFYTAFFLSIGYGIAFGFMYLDGFEFDFTYGTSTNDPWIVQALGYYYEIRQFFDYDKFPWLLAFNIGCFSITLWVMMFLAKQDIENPKQYFQWSAKGFFKFVLRHGYSIVILQGLLIGYFYLLDIGEQWWLIPFSILLLVPMLSLAVYISVVESINPFTAFGRVFKFMRGGFWKMIGIQTLIVLLSMLIMFLNTSMVVWMLFEMLTWNVEYDADLTNQLVVSFFAFIAIFSLLLLGTLWPASMIFYYHSQKELLTASSLLEKVKTLGERKTSYGVYTE